MSDICQLDTLSNGACDPSTDSSQRQLPVLKVPRFVERFSKAVSWILQRTRTQQSRKMLKVCESVSLGEKRFVAVVQVANERFLIGGAPSSVSMLARLGSEAFSEVLRSSQEAESDLGSISRS